MELMDWHLQKCENVALNGESSNTAIIRKTCDILSVYESPLPISNPRNWVCRALISGTLIINRRTFADALPTRFAFAAWENAADRINAVIPSAKLRLGFAIRVVEALKVRRSVPLVRSSG
jgi:hypothetical protein